MSLNKSQSVFSLLSMESQYFQGRLQRIEVKMESGGGITTAGLVKRVSCCTFRHSFDTHLFEGGYDVRMVLEANYPQGFYTHRNQKTRILRGSILSLSGL